VGKERLRTGGNVTVKFGSPLQFEPTDPPPGRNCKLAHIVGPGSITLVTIVVGTGKVGNESGIVDDACA